MHAFPLLGVSTFIALSVGSSGPDDPSSIFTL
jgi:hypothetical protein